MKEILEVVNGGTDNVSESGGRSVWPDVEFIFGSRLALWLLPLICGSAVLILYTGNHLQNI